MSDVIRRISRRGFLGQFAGASCLGLLGGVAPALAGRSASLSQEADALVGAEMERHHIPGLSLAIVSNGSIIKQDGYGTADGVSKALVLPNTIFRIGSISKQFFASAIMLLIERNQIGLNDPIVRYLRDPPAAWRGLTIRHLLTHTAGLARECPAYNPRRLQADAEVIASAYDLPLQSRPGDSWRYSNVGYFILAEIISVVTRDHWGNFIQNRILRPAGMSDTTLTSASVQGSATGYAWHGEHWRTVRDAVALRPSGAFLSTVIDLAKWDAALYGNRILSNASRAQMWTPVTLNDGSAYPYGFGWFTRSLHGRLIVSHGGAQPGFRSMIIRNVYAGVTAIVLTNASNAKPAKLTQALSRLYIGNASAIEVDDPPPLIEDQ